MIKGKKAIGIALILLSIIALVFWEKWGKGYLLYNEILVFTSDVKKGTTITAEMVEERKVEIAETDCLKKEDVNGILGKESAQYIHKGTPLFKQYFDKSGLVTGKNKYVLALPEAWLMTLPSSIYRGDQIYLYAGGKQVVSAKVTFFNQEDKEIEIIVSNEQAERITQIIEGRNKFVVTYN